MEIKSYYRLLKVSFVGYPPALVVVFWSLPDSMEVHIVPSEDSQMASQLLKTACAIIEIVAFPCGRGTFPCLEEKPLKCWSAGEAPNTGVQVLKYQLWCFKINWDPLSMKNNVL